MAKEAWLDILSDNGAQGDHLLSLRMYLELIRENAKGFEYELAVDDEGVVNGAVWQTATMRDNFERFGGYIASDSMYRTINSWNWPYMSITMYNELNMLCVGCEGFMCGERLDAYSFMTHFLIEKTPARSPESVEAFAGDGIFDEDTVRLLGFPNAAFLTDQNHLFRSALANMFGAHIYEHIKPHIRHMIYAGSEKNFNTALNNAFTVLGSLPARDLEAEGKLTTFASNRMTYSQYCLNLIPGTRGLRGSAMAEQNHSSTLIHLNDGKRGINEYCEQPMTLVKDLFCRQNIHVAKWNRQLYIDEQARLNEIERLNQESNIEWNFDLKVACSKLSKLDYEMYKKNRQRADQSLLVTMIDGNMHVTSIEYPDAPARVFADVNGECYCKERVTKQIQCAHKIKIRGCFCANDFQVRHLRRTKVSGSIVGWTPPNPTLSLNIFGHDESLCDDNDDETSNIIADESFGNTKAKSTSCNELIDLSQSNIRPLTQKSVTEVFSHITSFYSKCRDEVKFVVASMAIKMKALVLTKQFFLGHEEEFNAGEASSHQLHAWTKSIVKTYQSGFKRKANAFQPANHLTVNVMDASSVSSQPKKRLKSRKEQAFDGMRARATVNVPNIPGISLANEPTTNCLKVHANERVSARGCGFCASRARHTTTCCPLRKGYQANGKEYDVSKEIESNSFQRIITHGMHVIGSYNYPQTPIKKMSAEQHRRHMIVHSFHRYSTETLTNLTYHDVVAIISLIAQNGTIDKSMEMVPVLGEVVMRHILNTNTGVKSKSKYIYDNRAFASMSTMDSNSCNIDNFAQLSQLTTDDRKLPPNTDTEGQL